MDSSTNKKAVKGLFWTTLQRFAGMGIQFVSGIILARLLTPTDYGSIGMLTIFMLVAQAFMDGGLGTALIQKKRPTQIDYSTVFYWNLGMSIILYLLLFFSATYIASFYGMPILKNLLRVQAVVLIISALTLIQVNQLRKTFQFRKIAIVQVISSFVALVVTIIMAYWGYGVWALVAQNILMTLVPSVIYWVTNRWYPSWVFSWESFRELFSFGFFVFLTQVVNELCNNIHGLLIGRFYNASIMGYYSKAKGTEKLASTTVSQALNQVTLPLYAEYQHNLVELQQVIKKLTSAVSFVTFPLMLILILLAKPIFVLLYSDRWIESVPFFQILCLGGIAICLQSLNLQAISAIGKSKVMFKWTLIKRLVGLALNIGGLMTGGVYGLLCGSVLASWTIYIVNAYLVSVHVGYELMRQLRDLAPMLLLSIFAFVLSAALGYGFAPCYWVSFLQLILFVVVYLGGASVFRIQAMVEAKSLLSSIIKKQKGKVSINL